MTYEAWLSGSTVRDVHCEGGPWPAPRLEAYLPVGFPKGILALPPAGPARLYQPGWAGLAGGIPDHSYTTLAQGWPGWRIPRSFLHNVLHGCYILKQNTLGS